MPTEAEIRAEMAQFKADNDHVDWTKYEVYCIVDQETGEVQRMGYAEPDRIMRNFGTPEVGR